MPKSFGYWLSELNRRSLDVILDAQLAEQHYGLAQTEFKPDPELSLWNEKPRPESDNA